jgi:hypothetical protein
MKPQQTLLLIIFLFLSAFSYGQLVVDAGNDTIICIGTEENDSTLLGGKPTASGGTEPYTYSWSASYTIGNHTYGASHFLNDSSLANPTLVSTPEHFLKCKLTVTDHAGAQAQDSVVIRFSRFMYLVMDNYISIKQGDTASLFSIIGQGIEPLKYSWTPNYHLSDSSICCPNAWPDTTVTYQVIAIDSIGCISAPDYVDVYVFTTGINNNTEGLFHSSVFPNPIEAGSAITIDSENQETLSIEIMDASGKSISSHSFSGNTYFIGDQFTMNGIYLYLIKNNSRVIAYGRFIKK